MKLKCNKCTNIAVWIYMPTDDGAVYCDNCVPRGCSCNIDFATQEEDLDEIGRKFPCCEFWYDEYGVDQFEED